jgi:hypothetical protein
LQSSKAAAGGKNGKQFTIIEKCMGNIYVDDQQFTKIEEMMGNIYINYSKRYKYSV